MELPPEIQAARDAAIRRSREEQGFDVDDYAHQRIDGLRVRVDALEGRDVDWRQIAMASERSNRVLHDLVAKLNAECKSLRADLVRTRHEDAA